MAKPTDTRQPNTEQPPKIDKTELPSEKLDEVSGGVVPFVWGPTRIVPVRPSDKP
jgi:hypothetical protein